MCEIFRHAVLHKVIRIKENDNIVTCNFLDLFTFIRYYKKTYLQNGIVACRACDPVACTRWG